jgi:hypothetical protein
MQYSYVKCPTCNKKYRILVSFIERETIYINKINEGKHFDIRKNNPFNCFNCWIKMNNDLDEILNIMIERLPPNKIMKKRISELVSYKI